MIRAALCVVTYQRLAYLRACLDSFLVTCSPDYVWRLYVVDDGSTDGTVEYVLREHPAAVLIQNPRLGVHEARNDLFARTLADGFDLAFHADDDVRFISPGWDSLYWLTMRWSGYEHLVHYDATFARRYRPAAESRRRPLGGTNLQSWPAKPECCQGAFWTVTPAVLHDVGWFDCATFGPCGHGHTDFTLRCCRAGHNQLDGGPWDAARSENCVRLQVADYLPACAIDVRRQVSTVATPAAGKFAALADSTRIYQPRTYSPITMESQPR